MATANRHRPAFEPTHRCEQQTDRKQEKATSQPISQIALMLYTRSVDCQEVVKERSMHRQTDSCN